MILPEISGPFGASDHNKTVRVYARGGAVTRGEIRMFDLRLTDAAVTNNLPGDPASGLSNTILPADTFFDAGWFCLALEDAEDDHQYLALVEGINEAYVYRASGDVDPGDPLFPREAGNMTVDNNAAGDKCIAQALTGATAPTTAALVLVAFSGISPLQNKYVAP